MKGRREEKKREKRCINLYIYISHLNYIMDNCSKVSFFPQFQSLHHKLQVTPQLGKECSIPSDTNCFSNLIITILHLCIFFQNFPSTYNVFFYFYSFHFTPLHSPQPNTTYVTANKFWLSTVHSNFRIQYVQAQTFNSPILVCLYKS